MTIADCVRRTLALTLLAACGDDDPTQPDLIELAGDAYFPESLSASADGTLFVGSLATGQVTAFANGALEGRAVVSDASVTGVAGVHVEGDELWLCSIDTTFQRPTELRSFALDGTPRDTFALGAGFCNDLAFDDGGRLFVTDSFSGTVLVREGGALVPWLEDPSLAPAMAGAFGLDGIAFAGGSLYVTKFDTGGVYRIAIEADGSAGAVTQVGTFASPDGLRALGPDSLLLVEGAGRLVRLAIAGDSATPTILADDLDMPTAVVRARGSAWVTEGQLGRLFTGQSPNLPFAVRRVDL